jgi:hypothetical protein
MDDLTFLDLSREKLQSLIEPLQGWLKTNRNQHFHPGKTTLKSMNHGIDYLGYHLKQNLGTGEVELFAPAKKKWEFYQEVRQLEQTGIPNPAASHPLAFPSWDKASHCTLACLNSRLGFLRQSQSYRFRKETLTRLENRLKNPEGIPADFYDAWGHLRIRRQYRSIKLK